MSIVNRKMRYWLRHITRMRATTALILLLCALGMWIVDYVRTPEQWSAILTAQLLAAACGLGLCIVLYHAKAAEHFSLMPAILYVAAIGVIPYLRIHWQPQLISAVLLYFLFATRDTKDNHEPNGQVFLVTVLLCVTALWVPDALWCIVYLWIVMLLQGAFSPRTIMASLLGIALVGIYYAVAVYMGIAEIWDYHALFDRNWLGVDTPSSVTVVTGIMIAGFLTAASGAFRRSLYDLVSTRMLLYHVVMLGLVSLPLTLWTTAQPDCRALLPLALSATTSIYLLQQESETRGVSLLVYLTGAGALYTWLLLTL